MVKFGYAIHQMKLPPLLTLALLFLSLSSFAQSSSTAEINENAYLSYQKSNKQLIKVYQKVLSKFENYDMDGAAKKALIASQQSFINYRNKEAVFMEKKFRGGSMLPTFEYTALKMLTDSRRQQLLYYLSDFN